MEIIISDPDDYISLSNKNHPASGAVSIYHIPALVLENFAYECDLLPFRNEFVNPIKFNNQDSIKIRELHYIVGPSLTIGDCHIIYAAQLLKHCIVTNQTLIYKTAIEFNLNVVMTTDFAIRFHNSNLRKEMFKNMTFKTRDIT